ncbi:MAG: hypothetical protein ACO1SX_13655 [Actinomycetota bacterium]
MKLTWLATGAVFLFTSVGSSVQGDEPTRPKAPYTLRILPNAPVSVVPREAGSDRGAVLLTYPMVVVEKDPSLYPMVVTQGRDADYPIHIVAPAGAVPTTINLRPNVAPSRGSGQPTRR